MADIEALADTSSRQAQEAEAELASLDRQVAQLASRQDALLDMRLAREIDSAAFAAKSAQLAEKKTTLEEQAAVLAARRDAARANLLPLDDIRAACERVALGMDTRTFEERQNIVRTLCTRITVAREGQRLRVRVTGALEHLSGVASLADDATSERLDRSPRHSGRQSQTR
jgi:hypothetical protein